MGRWFRHYAGMMRDEKLVSVAMASKQPVERVVWVWGAILESAAEVNDGGRYELDTAEVAYFLRADEADICAILDSMSQSGRLAEGAVVNWGKRQFQSDKSATRQAAYRKRRRSEAGDGGNKQGDGGVTVENRHGDGPVTPHRQRTDTDTETDIDDGDGRARAFDLAAELAKVCGFPTPDHWPPGWCGSPMWVQKCLNEGWNPDVMIAETRAVCGRKRDGPIENFIYLEKPLAKAHARHQAPLPKVEIPQQEIINGSHQVADNRGRSAAAAAREMLRRLGGGEDCDAPLSLPPR